MPNEARRENPIINSLFIRIALSDANLTLDVVTQSASHLSALTDSRPLDWYLYQKISAETLFSFLFPLPSRQKPSDRSHSGGTDSRDPNNVQLCGK